MLFNSLTFLVFASLFFAAWHFAKDLRSRHILIVAGSYLFYGSWNAPYVLLLFASTWVNFRIGLSLDRNRTGSSRKSLLLASIAFNLGVLFFFKYFGFFTDTSQGLLDLLGVPVKLPAIAVALPAGISFFTFVLLGYTVDVWRGETCAERDFCKFTAFASFWPYLLAGPIIRAKQFIPQLLKRRRVSPQIFYQGLFLVSFGLFMKTVVADNMAPYVDRVYGHAFPLTTADAWLATYAYALQVFGDFSGYSNIAIGLALWMGFLIPENFNAPYCALSFTDFWRRWHISLSTWFRDYVFLLLAYSTHRRLDGTKFSGRTRNMVAYAIGTLLTMLLCGLWHGASWTFIAWGGLHGLYLAAERLLGQGMIHPSKGATWLTLAIRRLVVFHLVCLTWVLFRADFSRAITVMKALFGFTQEGAEALMGGRTAAAILLLLLTTLAAQNWFADKTFIQSARAVRLGRVGYVILISVLLLLSIIAKGGQGAFIYFRF
jgi:D-alanyl-lipoteichoic acid acyltransferase DltB (MBOAT superfamily)